MKYYKRLPINRKSPTSNAFVVEADGTIITDTHGALEIPDGNISQRPLNPTEGMMRFNTELGYFETYISGVWGPLSAISTFNIIQDEFDNGDYADMYFGPLSRDVDITKPQNVFVYVENVPQISNYNYTLEYSSVATPITTSTALTLSTSSGVSILQVSSVADFNSGQPITGSGIDVATTITATSVTDLTISLSLPTTAPIASGTVVTTTLSTGTWVKFGNNSLPVPFKPVFVITGFSGGNL